MGERRILLVALLCGLGSICASFVNSGLENGQHTLSLEKAKEIQTARREFHSLSHQYAHHVEGTSPELKSSGELSESEKSKVLAAEKRFNKLHAEIEAIRNSRPWLTSLLRYGGVAICLFAGLVLWITRRPAEQEINQASASSISAYEMKVRRGS